MRLSKAWFTFFSLLSKFFSSLIKRNIILISSCTPGKKELGAVWSSVSPLDHHLSANAAGETIFYFSLEILGPQTHSELLANSTNRLLGVGESILRSWAVQVKPPFPIATLVLFWAYETILFPDDKGDLLVVEKPEKLHIVTLHSPMLVLPASRKGRRGRSCFGYHDYVFAEPCRFLAEGYLTTRARLVYTNFP